MHGPLMAVVQQNKENVRPLLDFRELNFHLNLHTVEANVCSEKKYASDADVVRKSLLLLCARLAYRSTFTHRFGHTRL